MIKKLIPLTLLVLAAALLWTAGGRHKPLVALRSEHGLSSTETLENAPPLMTFTTVVLGGFRGLIADALWLRASRLKSDGKYVELVQLSDWITKLEPRCSEVWEFHAWNMAYNVSTMMPAPEDRWRWIQSGIRLIRDKGLYYNPTDARLQWYLGWIYQHKIGTDSDREHAFYKRRWAEEIGRFLDDGRPDYRRLATDPDLARQMAEELKLNPAAMKKIESEYGPLDWRQPEAYAIYWAHRGLRTAQDYDLTACERMIRQCLATLEKRANAGPEGKFPQ